MNITETNTAMSANRWAQNRFYAPDTVVLGLDIGIEGLGVAIRKGREWVYCKTLLMELPKAAALEVRRQMRAARRARKNYRCRMRRLKELFGLHGLPWVSDEVYERSDPFQLRYRAITGRLASKEALSLCIRSCVKLRGYDFNFFKNDTESEFPWGQSSSLDDAKHWVLSEYISDEMKKYLRDIASNLTKEKNGTPVPLDSDDLGKWYQAIDDSVKRAEEKGIPNMLKRYVHPYKLKNRSGFPWGQSSSLDDAINWVSSEYISDEMKEHLKDIASNLTKEENGTPVPLDSDDLGKWYQAIDDSVKRAEEKDIPDMLKRYVHPYIKARGNNYPRSHVREHLECILERHKHLIDNYHEFVKALFLPCDTKENKAKAIFYYNRKTKEEAQKHYEKKRKKCPYCMWEKLDLPQKCCGANKNNAIRRWKLVDFLSVRAFDMAQGKSPITRQLLPADAAEILVKSIDDPEKKWKDAKKEVAMAIKPMNFPKKDEWNKIQFKQLRDIINSGKGKASISPEAAQKLYELATESNSNFDPRQWAKWKKDSGLYEYRAKIINSYGGCYPQVERLLGRLRKKGTGFATEGWLQSIFRKNQDKLGGKLVPDYCVVECIKNAARNIKEKQELAKKQADSKMRSEKSVECYGSQLTNADRLRIRLFEEQGGHYQKKDADTNVPAICPFTGESLGCNPLDPELELAHLYPASRGGLYMAENLVLTKRQTNQAMGNFTPAEAAQRGLQGWQSWAKMLNSIDSFKWTKAKRELFAFVPSDEKRFPDFNNMTRTGQLAAELRRLVAIWMGINSNPKDMRERIGNPSGIYTAAARTSMLATDGESDLYAEYKKDRSNNTHHRIDAAIMTCIPPTGINDVRYGGIFYNILNNKNRKLYSIDGLPLPDFNPLLRESEEESPVTLLQGNRKTKPLGDKTFWAAQENGEVWQHIPLSDQMTEKKKDKLRRSEEWKASLRQSDDKTDKKAISRKRLQTWQEKLNQSPGILRMNDGTPIKRIITKGEKGDIKDSPLGWSAILTSSGKFWQLRKLAEVNDRLEIWLGWDSKKKTWKYYKRIIPTRSSLMGLKRMGMPWRGRKNAPPYLEKLLKEQNKPDLKTLVCGTLPPGAVKVGTIRKGNEFLAIFKKKEKEKEKQKNLLQFDNELKTWGAVSAIKSDGRIEIKCLTHKDRKNVTLSSVDKLKDLLKLPSAKEKAEQLKLE